MKSSEDHACQTLEQSQMPAGGRCLKNNKQESRKSSECKRWAKDSESEKSRLMRVRKFHSNKHQSTGCKLTEEEKHQLRRSSE